MPQKVFPKLAPKTVKWWHFLFDESIDFQNPQLRPRPSQSPEVRLCQLKHEKLHQPQHGQVIHLGSNQHHTPVPQIGGWLKSEAQLWFMWRFFWGWMIFGTRPETNSKRAWKLMVRRLLVFWEGLFSGAMLVSGRVRPTHFGGGTFSGIHLVSRAK